VPPEANPTMKLVVRGESFNNINNNETILPDLWLINGAYHSIIISVVVNKDCLMKWTVQNCTDILSEAIEYSNSISIDTNSVKFTIARGMIALTKTAMSKQHIMPVGEPKVVSVETAEKLYSGLEYPLQNTDVDELLCLVSTNVDFVIFPTLRRSSYALKAYDECIPYIECINGQYRYCLRILLMRDCDILKDPKLCNTLIPMELLTVTLNDEPYCGEYINMLHTIYGTTLIYKTTFTVSDLPKVHILQGCKLVASNIICNTDLRGGLNKKPITAKSLNELFSGNN
jgi:hypothetical protein